MTNPTILCCAIFKTKYGFFFKLILDHKNNFIVITISKESNYSNVE